MKFIDSLYTYEMKDGKRKRIFRKIEKGKKIRDLFLVVLPFGGDGLLEVFPYNQLLQSYYQSLGDDIVVVGMAKKKGCAMDLIQNIVQDLYDTQGPQFDVRAFFHV